MIHDSYATHACDVDELQEAIRATFYEMYRDNDVLQQYKDELESTLDEIELDELPTKGDLNLKEVLDAEYFFA